MFGTAAFGEAMFAEQAYRDMSIQSSVHTPWVIHVRTRFGVLLHRLDGWFNAQEKQRINQPGTFSLSMPLEHPVVKTGDLAAPNEIWILDDTSHVISKYQIREEKMRLDLRGNTYEIRGTTYLKSLSEERVTASIDSAETVEDVVDAVISAFSGTPAITKGFIEPAIGNAAVDLGDGNRQSLLSLLNNVRLANIGGWFEIDIERRLNWRSLDTTFPEQVFQLPSNLNAYEEKTRDGDVFNRIYATGGVIITGADPNDRLIISLPAPGYIEDAASIATYGRRTHAISDVTVRTQVHLIALATAFLADHKDPPIQRTLPAIDLSKLQQESGSTDEPIESVVRLGAPVILKPPVEIPGSPVPFASVVTGYSRKLDTPLDVTIEFGAEEIDIFRRLVQSIQVEGPTNITNIFNQDVEDLWQALDDAPGTFLELGDTPGAYSAGAIYQANPAEDELVALNLGGVGGILYVNFAGNALDYLGLGSAGGILQVNSGETALAYLGIGNAGQLLTPNSGEDALVWADDPYVPLVTGATKAALGTPSQISFGLITASGDNRLMIWDAEAVTSQANNKWRDVNSYGKAAT